LRIPVKSVVITSASSCSNRRARIASTKITVPVHSIASTYASLSFRVECKRRIRTDTGGLCFVQIGLISTWETQLVNEVAIAITMTVSRVENLLWIIADACGLCLVEGGLAATQDAS
jgi:hypothetical protein